MNLGILTSVETRHRFFVHAIRRQFAVKAVAHEETGYSPADTSKYNLTPQDERIVANHFAERTRQEEAFFGHDADFVVDDGSCTSCRLETGSLNSAQTVAMLERAGVDTVVVYGTNLIKPPLLSRWSGRMVNMHLGLSPYYRGTASNFYPLLNEEPQYVGATIHVLDAGIDSGPILCHARPPIVPEDMPHTIGCKAILGGIEAMITVLKEYESGEVKPVPQWPVDNPRLYLRKDYHPRQVVDLYQKIEAGLIRRYARDAKLASDTVRLIMRT